MHPDSPLRWQDAPGYRWVENGQSVLSGPLLDLYKRLDHQYLHWAALEGADEFLFPPLLAAAELGKIDYFRSFPHLVTFPATLEDSEENLRSFSSGEPLDAGGQLHPTGLAPIRDVLTPAACYHFYPHFKGQTLAAPRYVTTRATCFRREAYYAPLERQWSFSMREIVCLGNAEQVKAFLSRLQQRVEQFFARIELPIEWKPATDPFFNPSRNPKYLLQRLDPVKTEMVFQDRLAIGSINFHRNYFGEAFGISSEGEPAFSGCVAFGIERWIAALLAEFGPSPADWPELE